MGKTRSDLAWLLAPHDVDDFVSSYWEQRPLRLTRASPFYYKQLFDRFDLQQALDAAGRVGAVEEMDGETGPRPTKGHASIVSSFSQGRSLRIDALQRFAHRVARLVRVIEQELSSAVNVNLYMTPGETRALGQHFDAHDVFVLQVYGRKQWRIFDQNVSKPLEFVPPVRGERPEQARRFRIKERSKKNLQAPRNVVDEFVLNPGDCLYIPRGWWHEAVGLADQVSCHLTVGIQSFTYLDVLTVAIAAAVDTVPDLRASLPIGFATHRNETAAIAEGVQRILDKLAGAVDSKAAVSELASIFVRSRPSVIPDLLDTGGRRADQVSLSSSVQLSDGVLCCVIPNGEVIDIRTDKTNVQIPSAFETAARCVARGTEFAVKALPGDISDDERVTLATRLIEAGVLAVPSTTRAASSSDRIAAGPWLPARIVRRRAECLVRWVSGSAEDLREPFYDLSIKRLLKDPVRSRASTPVSCLAEFGSKRDPAGLIFHVSRCGSTLLANAAKTIPDTVVLSEPQPLSALLSALINETNPTSRQELMSAFKSFVTAGTGVAARQTVNVIIKWSSSALLAVKTIRSIWPAVPCIFVVRDPLEVLVSCMSDPPGWVRSLPSWPTQGNLRHNVEQLENDAARQLGRYYAAIKAVSDDGCVVHYEDLSERSVMAVVKSFVGHTACADESALKAVFQQYSKDPQKRRAFAPDGETKRRQASLSLKAAIDTWARPAYNEILHLIPGSTLPASQLQ